jgi:ribosome-associated protein
MYTLAVALVLKATLWRKISDRLSVPDIEFEFSFARSGGPGGQNVNKVSSKAILKWNI